MRSFLRKMRKPRVDEDGVDMDCSISNARAALMREGNGRKVGFVTRPLPDAPYFVVHIEGGMLWTFRDVREACECLRAHRLLNGMNEDGTDATEI